MRNSKIYLAGHRGMVGSAILQQLENRGYDDLVFKTSSELDLRNQQTVNEYVSKEKPGVIIIAAARVGGILANDQYPYQFLYDNLAIEAAHEHDIKKHFPGQFQHLSKVCGSTGYHQRSC